MHLCRRKSCPARERGSHGATTAGSVFLLLLAEAFITIWRKSFLDSDRPNIKFFSWDCFPDWSAVVFSGILQWVGIRTYVGDKTRFAPFCGFLFIYVIKNWILDERTLACSITLSWYRPEPITNLFISIYTLHLGAIAWIKKVKAIVVVDYAPCEKLNY